LHEAVLDAAARLAQRLAPAQHGLTATMDADPAAEAPRLGFGLSFDDLADRPGLARVCMPGCWRRVPTRRRWTRRPPVS
jgi:hypothetical protein